MAPSIFAEKDFSKIVNDVNGYGYVFLDSIRERHWYDLVYDNSESDAFYCPDLVKIFYTCIDTQTFDHDHNQFSMHFDTGDFIISIDTIQEVIQIPNSPQHTKPLPLIDYMTIMSSQCVE